MTGKAPLPFLDIWSRRGVSLSIAGYTRTGRVQLGPASDLIEMQGTDGARHTAIVFHPEYRKHNAINAALGVVLGFLESPMVTGLADLRAYDLGQSAFVYPTGQVWSVAEAVRTLGDLGEVGGVRAGVELMVAVGEILVEAAENGENQGVYSHGGLTPWRVVLDAEGRPTVIGHALPQVEILTFHEHPERIPREDAFRYCPPERMESRRENFSSDVFSLGLIAFEIMTGKPVYDGLVNDIRGKAARGETSRRIHQFRDYMPEAVRELLTTALRPDLRDRYASGAEFLDAARAALHADPDGGQLRDMMDRVSKQVSRARETLDPARTSMLSKEDLARLVEEDAGPIAKMPAKPAPAAPPRAATAAPPAAAPGPAPLGTSTADAGPAIRRLPPRLRDAEAAPAAPAPSVAAAPLSTAAAHTAAPAAAPVASTPASPATVEPAAAPAAGDAPRWSLPTRRPNPRAAPAQEAAPLAPAIDRTAPPEPKPEPRAAAPAPTPAPPFHAAPVAAPPPTAAHAAPAPTQTVAAERHSLPESARPVPPPPSVPAGASDRAADLLRRIRESSGDHARVASAMAEAAPEPAKPAPVKAEPEPVKPAPPATVTLAPVAPEAAPPKPPQPAQPAPVAIEAAPPKPALRSASRRTPDPVRTVLRGESAPYRLCRGPGSPVVQRRLMNQSALGDVVMVLVGQMVPMRATPDGRLTGWYRLGPAAGPLPASTRLDSIAAEEVLYFHWVPGQLLHLTVEAAGATLVLPVHTAVPVATLIDALASILNLPAGDWNLQVDGATLDSSGILEDVALTPETRLTVVKA